jgi:hypothetical protein
MHFFDGEVGTLILHFEKIYITYPYRSKRTLLVDVFSPVDLGRKFAYAMDLQLLMI